GLRPRVAHLSRQLGKRALSIRLSHGANDLAGAADHAGVVSDSRRARAGRLLRRSLVAAFVRAADSRAGRGADGGSGSGRIDCCIFSSTVHQSLSTLASARIDILAAPDSTGGAAFRPAEDG